MNDSTLTRRTLLTSTTLLATGLALSTRPSNAESALDTTTGQNAAADGAAAKDIAVYVPEESDFPYEIQRTEAEWREHLDNDELAYDVLRRAKTEKPGTTDLWLAAHTGRYLCRGCDLPLYEGRWFQELDKGWVFFHHAIPQSVMFALDGPVPQYGQAGMSLEEANAISEVHCRRCGSHVGHHLQVQGMFLHCINGTALALEWT